MANENRACIRINISLPISVADSDTLALADVLDLSKEGICFLSEKNFKQQEKVHIIFSGVEGVDENEVEALIWRSESSNDQERPFKIAAVFVDADLNYLENISKLLEEMQTDKPFA